MLSQSISLRRRKIPTSFNIHNNTCSNLYSIVRQLTLTNLQFETDNSNNHNRRYTSTLSTSCCYVPARNDKYGNDYIYMHSKVVSSTRHPSSSSRYSIIPIRWFVTKNNNDVNTKIEPNIPNDNNDDVSDADIDSLSLPSKQPNKVVKMKHKIDDEWIPPSRPLMGDVGQAHLYAHIEEDKELRELLSNDTIIMNQTQENENNNNTKNDQENIHNVEPKDIIEPELLEQQPSHASTDWLKTRRAMLTGQAMMKPYDAALFKQSIIDNELPIIEHTLFTQKELVQYIESLGGQNVEVVLDYGNSNNHHSKNATTKNKNTDFGRHRLGEDVLGIIIATGTNSKQMQTMATNIVRQLRRRKLEEVQVIGAMLGIDGNMNDPNENWFVVDCGNYIVHIQDAITRTAVNLEGLWSGKDPIRKVDCTDDNAIDEYVARYPVPKEYTAGSAIPLSSSLLYDVNNWDATMKQFEKYRWTKRNGPSTMINAGSSTRRKPVVPKRRRKTSGRKT
jgi:ribosomal silencing factor RsfS